MRVETSGTRVEAEGWGRLKVSADSFTRDELSRPRSNGSPRGQYRDNTSFFLAIDFQSSRFNRKERCKNGPLSANFLIGELKSRLFRSSGVFINFLNSNCGLNIPPRAMKCSISIFFSFFFFEDVARYFAIETLSRSESERITTRNVRVA